MALFAALGLACGTEPVPTRTLVEVHSNFGEELARVQVDVSVPGADRRESEIFRAPARPPSDQPEFLLSFAVAPRSGKEKNNFVVEVTGLDADGRRLVSARALGGFVRGNTGKMVVPLTRACEGVTCPDPMTTCARALLNVRGNGDCAPLEGLGTGTEDASQQPSMDAGPKGDEPGDNGSITGMRPPTEDGGGTTPLPGETCSDEGRLRCAMPGSSQRTACTEGIWAEAAPCTDGEVCVEDSADSASCRQPDSACIGNAGKAFCQDVTLITCDSAGLVSGNEECASARHCQDGVPRGTCAQCLAGEPRCMDARLEVCSQDGQGWEFVEDCPVEAPCNESAGACTDAACLPGGKRCTGDVLEVCNEDQTGYVKEGDCNPGMCDEVDGECKVCTAGAKRCEQNVAFTCTADGLRETRATCPSRCAGSGQCVECVDASDCVAPSAECRVATCSAAGECGEANAAPGTRCSKGTCSAGTCRCARTDDCGPSEVCNSGACVANRCGDGIVGAGEQCDDGNRSNTDACLNDCTNARCGDGYWRQDDPASSRNEECDQTAADWNTFTCRDCKQAIYVPCSSDSECPTTFYCAPSPFSFCTHPAGSARQCSAGSTAPTGCETIPGWSVTCGLVGCSILCDGTRCPNGLTCQASICVKP